MIFLSRARGNYGSVDLRGEATFGVDVGLKHSIRCDIDLEGLYPGHGPGQCVINAVTCHIDTRSGFCLMNSTLWNHWSAARPWMPSFKNLILLPSVNQIYNTLIRKTVHVFGATAQFGINDGNFNISFQLGIVEGLGAPQLVLGRDFLNQVIIIHDDDCIHLFDLPSRNATVYGPGFRTR
jgi:hypothetical protein